MGSILNDVDRTAIRQRIGSVTSTSVPRWGRMDAKAMLTHLKQSALMALGELPVACKNKRAFQVFPIKHLILHVCRSRRARRLRRSCWFPTRRLSTLFGLSSCPCWSASGQGRAKAMGRFTRCLAGSRSASGAWRRTSTRTITYASSGYSVRRRRTGDEADALSFR